MKICLLYVCVTHGSKTLGFASRFVASYHNFPPGVEHDTVVIGNGGPLKQETGLLFASMNNVQFWPRRNDPGWDISAYIEASKTLCKDYDMLVMCGESAHFHRAGWMKRFVEVWEQFGPGFYGTFSSYLVRPHLQTNGFACSPALLKTWEEPVTSREERYAFEHGPAAMWKRAAIAMLVTWDGQYTKRFWRHPPNIMWRGDQSNCLLWNNHTDGWFEADLARRTRWSANADFERNEPHSRLYLPRV